MSHLNDLIRQLATKDEALAKDIEREVAALADRREFGLNFERHQPEAVELPGRRVRRGDKVRILPPRGEMPKKANDRLWRVVDIVTDAGSRSASLESLDDSDDTADVILDELVVVAEFRDPIYPGLISTGKVERGGDKPYNSVINAENYHALQALLFTHRGKVDCIYIDPPYNTGAKDWKYNNDYVEGDDLYRHSKWLAFMERRLLLAKELLNADDSVLIVTIDEKEYLRLGLLLEQVFPEATIQMVSIVINPQGTGRNNEFSRTNEYVFFALLGAAQIVPTSDNMFDRDETAEETPIEWRNLRRRERESVRGARPNQFYAVYVDEATQQIHSVSDPIPLSVDVQTLSAPGGTRAIYPTTPDGKEMLWGVIPSRLRYLAEHGYARVVGNSVQFLNQGTVAALDRGELIVDGYETGGGIIARFPAGGKLLMPKTVWVRESHNSQSSGTLTLKRLIGDRNFPFPKSLHAVEDSLRFFIASKPGAITVDFFAGSGTTAHAVMRLNRQDGGSRRSISITNNEVSAREQAVHRISGLRPGDPEWEAHGICDYITKPRIEAAIMGKTPDGDPVKGDYKFTDEFPMAEGFEENVEFFTLTYESPLRVESNREFARIAPLLWLRAGSQGRRIDDLPDGWNVAETYGVISDLDYSEKFAQAITAAPAASVAFIITDEDRLFEALVRELPEHVEPVRLYEAYLRTFEIEARRAAER